MRVYQTCLKINILIAKLSWTVIIIFATVGDCHTPGQGGEPDNKYGIFYITKMLRHTQSNVDCKCHLFWFCYSRWIHKWVNLISPKITIFAIVYLFRPDSSSRQLNCWYTNLWQRIQDISYHQYQLILLQLVSRVCVHPWQGHGRGWGQTSWLLH